MKKILTLLFVFLFLFSCAKKEEQEEDLGDIIDITPVQEAPTIFNYSTNTMTFTLSENKEFVPNVEGESIVYSISPRLPNGLSLNLQTGVISGSAIEISSSSIYTVIASNFGGSLSQELNIQVIDSPPENFFYENPNIVAYKGQRIEFIRPNLEGGNPSSITIEPALPEGFVLNATNGTITGFSDIVQNTKDYTVTAINSGGSVETMIQLTVLPRPPINLEYFINGEAIENGAENEVYPNGLVLFTGDEITNLNPSFGGDHPDSYTVNPELPLGLSLDSNTGKISGFILNKSVKTKYTITASNASGSSSKEINIEVKDKISNVTVGKNFTCYTKGTDVFCSGKNNFNQLGKSGSSTTCSSIPCEKEFVGVNLNSIPLKAKSLSAGENHICALSFEDKVLCWGSNSFGESGDISYVSNSNPNFIKINENNDLENIIKISSGQSHTCALNTNKELYCWGSNEDGQLNNNIGSKSAYAVRFLNNNRTGDLNNVSDLSSGSIYTSYIEGSRAYISAGSNAPAPYLGNGMGSGLLVEEVLKKGDPPEDITNAKNIYSNELYSFLLLSSGELLSWGENDNKTLFNTRTDDLIFANNINNISFDNFQGISLLPESACLYLESNSLEKLYCQGKVNDGELGYSSSETITSSSMPVLKEDNSELSGLSYLSSGWGSHRCAVKENNKLYCWGSNSFGELGLDSTDSKNRASLVIDLLE